MDFSTDSLVSHEKKKKAIDFEKITNEQSFSDILHHIFWGISSANQQEFFESLVFHLTQVLKIDYAFISQLEGDDAVNTLAGCFRGNKCDNCVYQLSNTPCEIVIKEGKYTCFDNIKKVFTNDILIQKNNIESYIGRALYDQTGKIIGILCVMSCSPLHNAKLLPKIIDIFAISAARELEKKQADQDLDKLNKTLEELVQKRTNQLEIINQNLRREIKRRKNTEFQLIKQENKFKDLVYNIDNGIILVDTEGKIKFANPAALAIFEQPLQSLLEYDFGIPIVSNKPVELEIIKAKNKTGFVEMNVTFTEWEKESVYLVSIREITERKKAEEALIKAKEEADLANQAKTEFLANVSHELRTPMNAILGFAELLKLKLKAQEPPIYEYIETIYNSSNSLLSLINDLLDINQVEAGKIELNYHGFSVRTLLTEIINIFSNQASKQQLQLLVDIQDNVPEFINFDSLRLRQILVNLIGNSLKFTSKGYIKVSLSMQNLYGNYGTLKIEVQDTGIGIKDEDKQQIFEAFIQSQGQDNYRYGGNGLGLFITQKITEFLGGTITLDSEWGEGSTFTLMFADVEIVNSTNVLQQESCEITLNDIETMTILVVDNIPEHCDLIEGYFVGTEHNLMFANQKEIAINFIKSHCVDIILMNLEFDTINNSLEVLKILRRQNKTQYTPVISMTDLPLDMAENHQTLFQGVLKQPIHYSQLVQVLSKISLEKEEPKSNIDFSLTASDYQVITNVFDLLGKLQEIEEDSWNRIRQRMILSELQTFAHDLEHLGQTYNCPILMNYSEILANYLSILDIEQLSNTLEKFPQIRVSLLDYSNCVNRDWNSQP
ncbi:ATP-binding protein [Crocosphaera subtropica]|nr:ATP-binding protein [Crocosphaera subtropica]